MAASGRLPCGPHAQTTCHDLPHRPAPVQAPAVREVMHKQRVAYMQGHA
jgi:hypothetical protein